MKRAAGDPMSKGSSKRIPQICALLNQALTLMNSCDINSLPGEIQQAIALVSSAYTHSSHIMSHEGLSYSDAIGANGPAGYGQNSDLQSSAETRNQPKPDESTSTKIPDDDALRLASAKSISREIKLGLLSKFLH